MAQFSHDEVLTTDTIPFDTERLDRLMADAGIDIVVATSRFNTRYLLGGYYYWLNETEPAIADSHWLPFVGYPAGRLRESFYVGNAIDSWWQHVTPLWVTNVSYTNFTLQVGTPHVVDQIKALGLERGTIGLEFNFLPVSAMEILKAGLPDATFVDATSVLERLRGVKSEAELDLIRVATDGVTKAMMTVFREAPVGASTAELSDRLRVEQVKLGLTFDYALITAGDSVSRAPSKNSYWGAGEIASLDSGGNYRGYIGDICRMGSHGEPSKEHAAIFDDILAIQNAIEAEFRPGRPGREVVEFGKKLIADSEFSAELQLDLHGLGYVTHEMPRLMNLGHIQPDHVDELLEPGHVVSVETTFSRRGFGYIKLEDTVFVTAEGPELVADFGREWNVS